MIRRPPRSTLDRSSAASDVYKRQGEKYLVNLDSRSEVLDQPCDLVVRRAPYRMQLVQLEGQNFLDTLRSKLAWGLDIRSSRPGFQAG